MQTLKLTLFQSFTYYICLVAQKSCQWDQLSVTWLPHCECLLSNERHIIFKLHNGTREFLSVFFHTDLQESWQKGASSAFRSQAAKRFHPYSSQDSFWFCCHLGGYCPTSCHMDIVDCRFFVALKGWYLLICEWNLHWLNWLNAVVIICRLTMLINFAQ